jgi:hypothetical protein
MPMSNMTMNECNNACKNNQQCKLWVYYKNLNKCYLKTTSISQGKDTFVRDNTNDRGILMNNQDLLISGSGSRIVPLRKVDKINNTQECIDVCLNSIDCEIAIYDNVAKTCNFYTGFGQTDRMYGIPYK